jgi:hypothetical protein
MGGWLVDATGEYNYRPNITSEIKIFFDYGFFTSILRFVSSSDIRIDICIKF